MEVFQAGEQKIRPGTYFRTRSSGTNERGSLGVVGGLIRSTWGPTDVAVAIESEAQAEQVYGSGGTVAEFVRQALRKARRVVTVRQGSGGAKATVDLTAGVTDKVRLDAAYVGVRGNTFTVTKRVSLTDASRNEVLVYESGVLRETISYAPGSDDATALAAAVNAQSALLDAAVLAIGAVDAVAATPLAGGTDPTVNGAAQTAALALLGAEDFSVLAVDAEDTTTHALVAAQVNTWRNAGKRVRAVIGEPTSVAWATRRTNSAAFNSEAVDYVGHGIKEGATTIEGWKAAVRVAGEEAGSELTDSITHRVLEHATDTVGSLTNAEVEQAILSGMIVFTKNARRQVQIEYGINTLVNLAPTQDAGWKKIRRVRTRDELLTRVALRTDPLVGQVNNDPSGRALIRAEIQGAINELIGEGALLSGTALEDPANVPSGDAAYFVAEVDDLDSIEKIYETFGFRFAPPTGA